MLGRTVAAVCRSLICRSSSAPPATSSSTNLSPGSATERGRSLARGEHRNFARRSSVDGVTNAVTIRETETLAVQNTAYSRLRATPEDSRREWNKRMPDGHLVVYTDGSCKEQRSGFGIYMGPGHELNRSQRIREPPHNSQRPEILAIVQALKNILAWPEYDEQPVIVRTDALYAVQAISGTATLPAYQTEIEEIRALSSQIGGSVQFEHVYAHDGDPGNEAADELARQAVFPADEPARGRFRSRSRSRSRNRGNRSRSRENNKDHIRSHSTQIPGCSSGA